MSQQQQPTAPAEGSEIPNEVTELADQMLAVARERGANSAIVASAASSILILMVTTGTPEFARAIADHLEGCAQDIRTGLSFMTEDGGDDAAAATDN